MSSYSGLEEDCWNLGLQFSQQEKNPIWNSYPPSPNLLAGTGALKEKKKTAPTETEGCGFSSKKRRRRLKRSKNKEAAENQRMSHIAVERNRRRQMKDYLSVLRSILPASYVQKNDQASIIGGAINYVKELEHLLHILEAGKQISHQNIDVTMVDSHVNLKVLSRQRPRQLLNMMVGLQNLRLTTLHLSLSTMFDMVLYSFNLKVEEDCELVSVDKVRTAVQQMMRRIQEAAGC
ncbi:Transcription factor bHLH94 [Platanthera guangdongensis]|uniref:Transcription factor bHLH94 n=1 Tax=Platanthera guangdongensis TaxID=2320717 RepID=A0ABR2LI64_9ASPA